MATSRSDALVIFGVTGDLAHKMIFPALYAMVKRGTLKVPVIGVALPNWSLARLRKRVLGFNTNHNNNLNNLFPNVSFRSARQVPIVFGMNFY